MADQQRNQIWDLSDHRGTTGSEASMITGTEICSTTVGWVAKVQVFGLCPFFLILISSLYILQIVKNIQIAY